MSEKVVYLADRREQPAPLELALVIRHREDAVCFKIFGGDRERDNKLVADALEAIARDLRGIA